jgi:CheY-like chemotaxis protein
VCIEVRDSGVGIAPEHHDKVFEEFYQVGNPERDRTKGLGLGLSIVQRSCQLLGHAIQLRSSPGRGTCFCVMVPITQMPASACAALADPEQANELQGRQVLLIEDDVQGGLALQGLLQSWGCQVTLADSALAACDLVRGGAAPDFVLSDYRLRGAHTGIDAVRMVREVVGVDSLPACLISGDTAADVRQQAQSAGLVLLQKPVRPAKLRSVLRHIFLSRTDALSEA